MWFSDVAVLCANAGYAAVSEGLALPELPAKKKTPHEAGLEKREGRTALRPLPVARSQ
jgi:hypothetical protein